MLSLEFGNTIVWTVVLLFLIGSGWFIAILTYAMMKAKEKKKYKNVEELMKMLKAAIKTSADKEKLIEMLDDLKIEMKGKEDKIEAIKEKIAADQMDEEIDQMLEELEKGLEAFREEIEAKAEEISKEETKEGAETEETKEKVEEEKTEGEEEKKE